MRNLMIAPAFALLLAGCGGATEHSERNIVAVSDNETQAEANPTVNAVSGENVTAQVLAMNERERNVVFVRALMDAGLPCDGVSSSERVPDQEGKPVWRADCRSGNGSHLITITPDGIAQIVSRSDR